MISLAVEDVTVSFPIYEARQRSLKNRFLSATTGGRIAADARHRIVVEALRGITFELTQGQRVALFGFNGAGKTTLLRVLAGIYEPVTGRVCIHGRIAPLLDRGLGIDPESTGYQFIHLRGRYLGLSTHEMQKLTDEIVDFSELGDFLHLPIRTYSAGMSARLAFAVSTSITPEILLLDEGITAADAKFMHKASARMAQLVQKTTILVFATHNLDLAKRFCTTGLLLERGQIIALGPIDDVHRNYVSRQTMAYNSEPT
jgi:ABC-2 type transport system ATP-binding protein/lipopolysaccharide transport system ATP-binding protein